jgi:hypothetical protein
MSRLRWHLARGRDPDTARLTARRTARLNAGRCLSCRSRYVESLCSCLFLQRLKERKAVHTSSSQVHQRPMGACLHGYVIGRAVRGRAVE